MDFKFRRESITANNDTAPVNGVGLNTPDGVGYLSAESGELKFKGEAIGGGGGLMIVNLEFAESGIVANRTFSDIYSAYMGGTYVVCDFMGMLITPRGISENEIIFSLFLIENQDMMVMEVVINNDNTMVPTQRYFAMTEKVE